MVTIESTAEMAAKVYETMERNLAIVRRRLGRPLTLADKMLLGHADDPEHQEMEAGKSYLFLRPDRVVLQDVLGQTAMLQFMQTRRQRVAVPTSIHCDHLIQARVEGQADLRESLAENQEVYDFLKSAAAKYGAGFWGPGAGIIHQVVLEQYAFPGELIIGTDSHTPNAGGLGACAVGVGGADAVEVMAGLPWEVLYPRHIAVYLTGKLSGWTAPKDVILYVAGQLTVAGGTNAIVEYIGPGARTISATGKATITNMGAELGATTSMFPFDDRMTMYLKATGRGDLVPFAERYPQLLAPDKEVEADPEKYYERVVKLDLSTLEPYMVGPHSPDRARPIGRLAAEVADPKNAFLDTISSTLIGSPEIVTALAIAGRLSFNPLTDSLTGADGKTFKLSPPKTAPEVPARNFDRGRPTYVTPPEDGSAITLKVDPKSERLQLMEPWPAWDGQDFKDMPVLLKAKGKTTTDHISPAGSWLRYRGHLDKFSDNMFMGATNAYTGEAGKGKNVLTGQTGQSFSAIARDYKSKGVKWVVVGDANYGEGSSREHAALSPRLLGAAAVIVRSFARIHESNLKKQGLLALAFQNPGDYDRIREDDRISLIGLSDMAPGKPVECVVKHSDGTSETLRLSHSFATSQLEWFRKGSALNLFHGK